MELREVFCIPIFVTWPWSKALYLSLRQHFPSTPVIIVDQNPGEGSDFWKPKSEIESEWFTKLKDVKLISNRGASVFNFEATCHGKGIDLAVIEALSQGYNLLIHLDADSLILGSEWYNIMKDQIANGMWAVSGETRWHGYAGLSPSMWRIDMLNSKFVHTQRGIEAEDPRIEKAIQFKEYLKRVSEHEWFLSHWDTAQLVWLEAALVDKAIKIDGLKDYKHFGGASRREVTVEERLLLQPFIDTSDIE